MDVVSRQAKDQKFRTQVTRCCLPINPERNKALRIWDTATGMALIFVIFVSPYEVAFVSTNGQGPEFLRNGADGLFWLNRFIDLLFIVDMALQFFIMYPIRHTYGMVLITDRKLIIKKYLKGWFAVDLISILPFDILGIFLQSADVRQLKGLRIVRLLRLLKLVRLLRGARIKKRWEVEISLSYRKISTFGLMGTVLISTHWMGCVLGIITNFFGDECLGLDDDSADCTLTWFSPAAMEMTDNGKPLTDYRRYTIALYVAATVIVHPHFLPPKNEYECIPFIILIFIGGLIWTRVISRSTALITSMDRHTIHYQQTMDDLNAITRQKALSHQLRRRLRAFFMNTRDSSQRKTWTELTSRMSPQLKLEVLYQTSKDWIRRVPYLACLSKLFLRDLTVHLQCHHYAQKETFGANFTMYILKGGLCNWSKGQGKLCLLKPGSVWGEEHMFLSNWELLWPNTTISLSFSEVLSLEKWVFQMVCEDYPEYHEKMRRYHRWYAAVRGILAYTAKEKAKDMAAKDMPDGSKMLPQAYTHDADEPFDLSDLTKVVAMKEAQAKRNIRRTLTDDSMQKTVAERTNGYPERSLSIANSNFPALNGRELEKRLTARLDQLEHHLDRKLDDRLGMVDARQQQLDDRLGMVDARQAALESLMRKEFAALHSRLLSSRHFVPTRPPAMQVATSASSKLNPELGHEDTIWSPKLDFSSVTTEVEQQSHERQLDKEGAMKLD